MKPRIILHKSTGGFSGHTYFSLHLDFIVSGSSYDQEALLKEAKENTKQILEKLGIDINVDEIKIKEDYYL